MPSSLTILLPPALGFSPHPPVSVFGTGTLRTIAAFLDITSTLSPTFISVVSRAAFPHVFCPVPGFPLSPRIPSVVASSRCVPAVLSQRSTGISTCRPSATASALALGPDLPRADQLDSGNLGYSARGIPALVSLLIPAFSLPARPRALAGHASSMRQCSSTNAFLHSRASAACFSPGYFRRRTSRLVSYYALFE